jgi:ribonuclease HII
MGDSQLRKINWRKLGFNRIAGTDEVGRGCLAGPVYAAAVILRPEPTSEFRIRGITDSKLIPSELRSKIAKQIERKALCFAVASATVEEIDSINILRASLLAMRRAVTALEHCPEFVVIDGNQRIGGTWEQATFIKGDLRCAPIGAASILAKVARDLFMEELDEKFPGYGFKNHKGYGTPEHRKAIKNLGPCPFHRRTFAGVSEFYQLSFES